MIKDYVRDLFGLLADGKLAEFTRQGNAAIQQIDEDVADLQKQATFIRRALTRHGIASEVKPPLTLTTGQPLVSSQPSHPLDNDQRRVIRETTDQLAIENGEVTITTVLEGLAKKGVTLTVAKPRAVVGTMLARWKDYEKTGEGKYKKIN